MKRMGLLFTALIFILAAGCSVQEADPSVSVAQTDSAMTVISSGITDGVIDPAYGKNGEVQENGVPALSLPLEITGAPEGTVCFAVYMDDPDAKPLCGYRWVHWMAAGIETGSLLEDFSRTAGNSVVQGKNDNGTVGYAGPQPPDKDHTYVITVYALDAVPDLVQGFSKEEFFTAIDGHVLAAATLEGIYRK